MSTNFKIHLTPYQALFYYEWLKNPLRSDYNMVMDSLVSGKLNLEKCEEAFIKIANEHFVYNHSPATDKDGFYWKPREKTTKLMEYYPSPLTDEEMYDLVSAPFNLEEDCPIRMIVIKIAEDKFRILLATPHLVIDGLTTHQIYEKWAAIYNGGNFDIQSYEEQIQMSKNLSAYFEDVLTKNKEKIDEFWSKHLQDVGGIDFTFLKTNIVKPKSTRRYVSEYLFSYDKDIATRVASLRHSYKITPYIFGQLVLAILVHKITGQKNIAINYPIALLEGADFIYGAHVNSILIDYRFEDDTTVGSLITYALDFFKQLKNTKSRYLPIPEIVQYAEDTNVLELAFAQTFLRDINLDLNGITLDKVSHQYQIDLVNTLLFEQEQYEGRINYRVKYDKDVLDPDLVKQFCSLYEELFLRILDDLSSENAPKEIQEYTLLDDEKYKNIVVDYNQRRVPFSEEKTLSQLIEEQVARWGDKVALICNDNALSYKELNEQANRLAHYLKEEHNIQKGDFVGLFLDRTPHMIVAILAVLKAGAAYVPMDSSMPAERISFILSDTKAKTVLTNRIHTEKMKGLADNVVIVDDNSFIENILSKYSSDNLGKIATSNDLAYIIYTSGTTGNPKGVMIEHRNVNRLIINTNFVSIDETDTILSLSSYQFDGSIYDFFAPLLNGATLVLSDKEAFLDLDELNNLIGRYNVTNFFITTSLFNSIADANLSNLKQLKFIISGGEAASLTHMRKFRENFGNVQLINGYGPTETTVFANCYQVDDAIEEFAHSVPIGKPINNTTSYILDQWLNPLPLGAIGELYIGGAGVSRGYLNNPELTAERFIPNPFQTDEEKESGYNGRLYKTGDLVRMLPDGNIDYIGRNDFQVKIRGFRIELGEIETAFTSYTDADISQAVVLAKEHSSGSKYLVAYYVSDEKQDEDAIRNYLADKLPDYMIPSVIMHLRELPTTVNGKLDIRQLPEFSFSDIENYVAPENEVEQKLVNVFAEVLNLDPATISTTDDFYRLGGNSIQVIRLTSKINEALGIKIHVTNVFEHTTIKKLVAFISKDISQEIRITKSQVKKPEDQVLSFAQQRLWFIESYEGGSNAYNVPLIFKLGKDVDVSLLEPSIRTVVDRHEILRSLIKPNSEGKGYQVVIDGEKYPLVIENQIISSQDELIKEMDKSIAQIFDLSKDYPIHIKFYTLNSETYLSIVVHHIAFDGWSTEIFIREMLNFYKYQLYLKKGDQKTADSYLPAPIEIQYHDFSIWQRNYLQGEILEKQLDYWRSHLSDFETLNLVTDNPRPAQIEYNGADIEFTLDAQTSAQLVNLAKSLNISMYNLLLSAYYLLLSAYSNQEDIVIGSPIAGRQYPEIADTIGFFVNTLAIRQKVYGQQLLSEFISQVANASREAQNNQDLPFEKLVEELNVDKDSSRHPIFQVMFGVQSFGKKQMNEMSDFMSLYTEGYGANFGVAKFDITTIIDDSEECFRGVFNYATALFEKRTIKSYINSYIHILEQFANLDSQAQSSIRLRDIQLLDTKAYDLIVHQLNDTKQEYDKTKNICQVFEEQVQKTPQNIALIFEDIQLTYAELNEKANQLSYYLKEGRGVQIGDRVALSMSNSEYLIICILGILKAGAAYVPMEVDLVNERLNYIINDSKVSLLLTEEKYAEKFENIFSGSNLDIEAVDDPQFIEDVFKMLHTENLQLMIRPDSLSYIIYTSGTTGNPKGVMVQHLNTVNFVLNADYVDISESDNTLSLSSYQFDGSIYDFFMPLLKGASLILSSKDIFLNLNQLNDLLLKHKITNFFITTALFNTITDANLSGLANLKYIAFGGEAASLAHIKKFKENFRNVKMVNGYGPTETTTFSVVYQIPDSIFQASIVPIGKPIKNYTAYILDKYLRPLPLGAIGELYIGGNGVTKGYLNNPEQTQERFIPNPFQTQQEQRSGYNGRLYKSGDLVRYRPDGNIEYIGRNDFQVKIRGYRIELGEIETLLNDHPDIKQSIIIVKSHQSGIKYLVGYYMAEQKIDEEKLRAYLGTTIPEYMIPSQLVHLIEFPLNVNGKIDRKRLPDIQFTNKEIYIAPQNDIEKELCTIYGEVLGLDPQAISMESDFFKLGGDSISSIQLVNRIRQQMNVHLAVRDIFDNKTIRTLYNNKVKNNNQVVQKIQTEQGMLSGEVGLLPIQKWFLSNVDKGLLPEYNHFNQAFMLKVPILDQAVLEASVQKLIEYHDAFRLSFNKAGDEYTQFYNTEISDSPLLCLDIKGLSDQEITDTFTKWQSGFGIFNKKLFHIAYLTGFEDGAARIHIAMHHLIVDAVSWRLIKNDLETIYHYLYTHKEEVSVATILGEKGSSYRQWINAVHNYRNIEKENINDELHYWRSTTEGISKSNDLLTKVKSDNLNRQELVLNNALTDALIRKVHTVYNSQINDVLLTAFHRSLSKLTGSSTQHILLEGHGRETITNDININNTVGWFTIMYPVQLSAPTDNWGASLAAIKDMLHAVPNNGIGYGALIGYKTEELPRIAFNYLGQFDSGQQSKEQWTFCNEDSGVANSPANRDNNILSINGGVVDGKLRFSVAGYLHQKSLTALTDNFKEQLTELITYLSQADRSYLTLSDTDYILSQSYLDTIQTDQEVEGIYMANSLQQGFIFHAINQSKDDAYKIQIVWKYSSAIDSDMFRQAWQAVQQTYPSLRLRFAWDEELVQIIDKKGVLNWEYIDISHLDKNKQDDFMQDLLMNDRQLEFDLQTSALFRVYLIKQSGNDYACLFSNHHAILDGWSMPVLIGALHRYYTDLSDSKLISYKVDLAYPLTQKYLQDSKQESIEYWENYLSGFESSEDLNGLLKPSRQDTRLADYNKIEDARSEFLKIGEKSYQDIKQLCMNNGITLNALLQYCWHKQLSLYGNTDTTVLGMTIAGRNLPIENIEQSAGLYINTLPIILEHKDEKIIDSVKRLQSNINDINSHSGVNLTHLQKNGIRLFNTLFVFENYPKTKKDGDNRLDINIDYAKEKLDYPIGVSVFEEDGIELKIQYAGELFDKSTIDQLLTGMSSILLQLAANPSLLSNELNCLNDKEFEQTIYGWNQTLEDYPENETIVGLFEKQVNKTPSNIAIVYGNHRLTYKQVNEQANCLGAYLRDTFNIHPDNMVALYLKRSQHMLTGILGVMKSGGAYVPIDVDVPKDRLCYILQDTEAKVILCNADEQEALESKLEGLPVRVIAIDAPQFLQHIQQTYSAENPTIYIKPNNLIYIIYTSGTTGNPKGVMLEHRGIVNLATAMAEEMQLNSDSVKNCLWYANYVFDAHAYELYKVITTGNPIFLLEEDKRRDIDLLRQYIVDNNIEIATIPPALLEKDVILDLQILTVAGESTPLEIMNNYRGNGIKLINAYGPTEDSVCSTFHHFDIGDNPRNIGRPIANTTAYILNKDMKPLPIGVLGDLYVGGAGIARGYLKNTELTASVFKKNPFQTEDEKESGYNGRLYKTGDIARFLENGDIEFIGRSDFQVKIRGFRIELGEIETQLMSYPEVEKAIVLVHEQASGVKYLVGYYISEQKLDEEKIIQHLKNSLPEYMIPSLLMHLTDLPMTINGKINRKELPSPDWSNQENYVSPGNETEVAICNIFSDLLAIEANKISVEDDFFRLGGSSILAIKLMNQLNKEFDIRITIGKIFANRTIRKLAQYIEFGDQENISISKVSVSNVEDQVLSFAQERIWFIESYEGGSNAYNIPLVFEISEKVHIESLEKALVTVIHRHEVLHSYLKTTDEGTGYQLPVDDEVYPIRIHKRTLHSEKELHAAINSVVSRIFNLEFEFPIHIQLYTLGAKRYVSIIMHHIASDGWSTDIFIKELMNYYHYEEALRKNAGQDILSQFALPDNSIQYKDYALWQRNYLNGERLDVQLEYWKNKIVGYEVLNLPTDNVRPVRMDYAGSNFNFEINETLSEQLRQRAKELNVSLYSLLLSGYYLLLSAYSNQEDIVVGTPVAGRHYSEVKDLIGLFVNTLVMRMQIDSEQNISDFITQVGKSVNEAQCYQDLPFEKLVNELKVEKDTSRNPIFQVMFGLQSFGSSDSVDNDLFKAYNDIENLGYHAAKLDITTMMDDSQASISGVFNYATSLFENSTMAAYAQVYTKILEQLAINQSVTKIKDITYLPEADYQKMVIEWNNTPMVYPSEKTIHQMFQEQVARTPNSIAVIYKEIQLTYRELNEKANLVAAYLKDVYKVQPDDMIGVVIRRSEYFMITILGILKAGAAYVPMDPNAPDERIAFMVNDLQSKVVLTDTTEVKRLSSFLTVDVDVVDSSLISELQRKYSTSNVETEVTSQNLAYIIYTSGTTGNPKGVMIQHESVINRIVWMNHEYPILPTDKVLQKTTYTFDVSVWELFWANWYGATLVLADPEEYKDNIYLLDIIRNEGITIMHFVPSMLIAFEDVLINNTSLQSSTVSLRYLFCSGEALGLDEVQKYHQLVPDSQINNLYGPTEATVDVLYYDCNSRDIQKVLIGKPIANTAVYILDKNLRVLPVGAIGELFIGGMNVGRGYLNNKTLTDQKFIENPFQTQEEKNKDVNGRMYKTGDLVRYLSDGNIEYLGRNDFQVKIRGFRIELGEIETNLLSYPSIKQTVVVARKHSTGDNYLAGYYVADKELDRIELENHLLKNMPDYMVPKVFVRMDEFPLSANGKLDRKQLPEPTFVGQKNYIAPETEQEKDLAMLFGEVLNLDPATEISVEDDFYTLGGSSILAIRLVYKINNFFNSRIRLVDIVNTKSIRHLASILSENEYKAIVELNENDKEPIFMVHPGMGGCEVYVPLASRLKPYYHCYGIDSYNLYHDKKIKDLSEIAEYYLSQIDKLEEKPTSYNLLGWSLGGQISLEIAAKLEERGETDITVYLLDTWISVFTDETIDLNLDRFIERFGIRESNREQIMTNMNIDTFMHQQRISHQLKYTKGILFKAIEGEEKELINQYPYNNIEKNLVSSSQLNVKPLETDHHSILDLGDVIVNNIINYR